jgi:ATP sulfurylase
VYVDGRGYLPRAEVPPGAVALTISGTRLRELLTAGAEVPPWLAAPDVVAELAGAFSGATPPSPGAVP